MGVANERSCTTEKEWKVVKRKGEHDGYFGRLETKHRDRGGPRLLRLVGRSFVHLCLP